MNVTRLKYLIATGLIFIATVATAQTYPDKKKPIKIIAPYAAGSSVDQYARAIARAMGDAGFTAIVDNRSGGEGIIAVQATKLAPPDGYTLLLTTQTTQVVNPHLLPNLPYDPIADFVPLVGVAKTALYFNVGPGSPFKSVGDFVTAARANPGKYTIGSASALMQVAAEMIMQSTGVDVLIVPYKSASEVVLALAGNQIDAIIMDAAGVKPAIERGGRTLANTSPSRNSQFPGIPTMREEGLKDYDVTGWFATYFPANTSPAHTKAMQSILRDALKSKYVTDIYEKFAMAPLDVDLDAFQRSEHERWGRAMRAANLTPTK